jgi:hypothetical protein
MYLTVSDTARMSKMQTYEFYYTSETKHFESYATIVKTRGIMLFMDIITVYCQRHLQHKYTV